MLPSRGLKGFLLKFKEMDISLKTFDDVKITPQYGNYACNLELKGISIEELVKGMTDDERKELLSHISMDLIQEHIEEYISSVEA